MLREPWATVTYRNARQSRPLRGANTQANKNNPKITVLIAPAVEMSNHSAQCIPSSDPKRAITKVIPKITGKRSDNKDAVVPGKINMAITNTAPTASKELTTTMASKDMRA